MGYKAGDNITNGSKNIIIGFESDAPSTTASYQLNIGNIIYGTNIDGSGSTISSGNIGIGTNNPSYKLEVSGTAAKPGGGSWSTTSDRRLKENILNYNVGLETLLKINPVSYNYNNLSGFNIEPQYVGVIAQELQEILPDLVHTFKKNNEEYLSVDNSAMTYILINAVKEQQVQIEKLEKLVDQLLEGK